MVMTSARTEEGLPFLPIEFINEIIWSNLAKAQNLFGQEISEVMVEANQFHFILKVTDPESLPKFIGYFKQETAHAINRLLGRRRKTVWVGDYDAPTILDLKRFLQAYAYSILNPVKDQQAASLDEFEGVSSWEMLKKNITIRRCRKIARNKIPRLSNPHNPAAECKRIMTFLQEHNLEEIDFKLDLFSWKTCFPETKDLTDEQLHALLIEAINEEKSRLEQEAGSSTSSTQKQPRTKKGAESLLREYRPKKFSPKSICISTIKELRVHFIKRFKSICQLAREIYGEWKSGNFIRTMPPGLFSPGLPRLANCLTHAFV